MSTIRHDADVARDCYALGAVDLNRSTRRVGFEQRPVRDVGHPELVGGAGFAMDAEPEPEPEGWGTPSGAGAEGPPGGASRVLYGSGRSQPGQER